MNKTDKDSYFKQLAIRYCLSVGQLPCPEVIVFSPSDLTAQTEPLTDLDVLGLETIDDGRFRRTLFDCKTGKMSAINRALWARGLMEFAKIDHSIVILKKPPPENHRLAATNISVDLHTEDTFADLAALTDPAFDSDSHYQSTVDGWRNLQAVYEKWGWSDGLYDCVRFQSPVTQNPAKTFRRLLSDLRSVRGEFDPSKADHRAIFFDSLCGFFILWSSITRDVRRIFRTSMNQQEFLQILRYYLWGGQEAYGIRRDLSKNLDKDAAAPELPEWGKLEKFTSHAVSSPRSLIRAAWVCRELSIREVTPSTPNKDAAINEELQSDSRLPQLLLSAVDYLGAASRFPQELQELSKGVVADLM